MHKCVAKYTTKLIATQNLDKIFIKNRTNSWLVLSLTVTKPSFGLFTMRNWTIKQEKRQFDKNNKMDLLLASSSKSVNNENKD